MCSSQVSTWYAASFVSFELNRAWAKHSLVTPGHTNTKIFESFASSSIKTPLGVLIPMSRPRADVSIRKRLVLCTTPGRMS